MPKKPPRRDPIIVYKREEKGLKPFLPKNRGFRFGPPPPPPPKVKKNKDAKPVAPEYVIFHENNLKEIDSMPSPQREIARVCYYLCFLVHETKTSSELFPLKHNALEKIFKSGHPCLTVHYVRRGDREDSNKHHVRLYLTPKCKIEYEEGYFDLYHFHIVLEPFRFSFYLPIHQAPWLDKRRLSKRKFHYPQTVEYGLVRGRTITGSRKATLVPRDKIKEELNKFLAIEIDVKK